jgi:hypothetical protein
MPEGSADPPPREPSTERYGILGLARLRKDDGRSLILYRDAEEGAQAGRRGAGEGEPA